MSNENKNNEVQSVDLETVLKRLEALETENKALKEAQTSQAEEIKKQGFTANDLIALQKQVTGVKDNANNQNKISFKTVTYVKDGLPIEEDVVSILAPERKGVEIIQKITLDLVTKMGNYAESFATYFTKKAKETPALVNLEGYSDTAKGYLIKRGVFTKKQLNNIKAAALSNLITPVYGQKVYLEILKEVQKDLRVK